MARRTRKDKQNRREKLLTWLNESTIIDPTERIARFNALGSIDTGIEVIDRDASYYEDMDQGEE